MFGWRRDVGKRSGRTPRVPEGVVVYAVGDIHGRLDCLTRLLQKIEEDAAAHQAMRRILVFVGDYVDRGPHSRGVIERVIGGMPSFETVCLKGNHEQILLEFLSTPALWEEWRRFGGLETLASYDLDKQLLFGAGGSPDTIRDAFLGALPERHYDFLNSLRLNYECGDYYFVHAGVRPGIPLERQVDADQLWIRDEFLNAGDVFGGRVVVHGHTPTPEPERLSFRLGIDTGAYLTGRLTAARLSGTEISFLQS